MWKNIEGARLHARKVPRTIHTYTYTIDLDIFDYGKEWDTWCHFPSPVITPHFFLFFVAAKEKKVIMLRGQYRAVRGARECVCSCAYVCAYMCVCEYVFLCVCKFVCLSSIVSVHVCVCVRSAPTRFMCVFVYSYVCLHVCDDTD